MKIINLIKEEIKSQILKERDEDDYLGKRGDHRRKNKVWEGDNLRYNVEGLEATAVLEHLKDKYDISEGEIDVYDLIPVYTFYNMTEFEVDHPEFEGMTFIAGDEKDTYNTAVENVESILEDTGIGHLPDYMIEANIDKNHLRRDLDYMVSDWVWDDPDGFIDDDTNRTLSHRQQLRVEYLSNLINKYDNEIRELEKTLGGDEDELTKKMIDKYMKVMEKQEDAVRDIENSPEGDYPEEMIENYIKNHVDDLMSDLSTLFDDYGIDAKKYLDMEGVATDIVDSDGVEHSLNLYDGTLYEYKVIDKYYSVGRFS